MADDLKKEEPVNTNEEVLDFIPVEEEKGATLFNYEDGNAEEVEESTDEVVEESKEEAPKEETPKEETQEIKDIPHKEDPSRFEYWQSKFSQEQNARKELEEKLHQLEQNVESFSKPPEPEPLKPPVKPNSDDPLDKIEYLEKLTEYNNQLVAKQQKSFEEQQKALEQQQQQAQFKAYMIGEYQKAGADEKLSAEAFNFFSSEDSLDPMTQIGMYKAWKGAEGAKPNPKVNQVKDKMAKQNVPLPPGVGGGESDEPKQPDFGDDLLAFTKKYKV